ncbi:MAG: hypothetical protein RL693_2098 [Verrucomicrobiota bacterium]|jgi:hypothetical protein
MNTLKKLLIPVSCLASLLVTPAFAHHTDFSASGITATGTTENIIATVAQVPSLDCGPGTRSRAIGTPYKFTLKGLQCVGHGMGWSGATAGNFGTGSYGSTASTYQPSNASAANLKSLTYSASVTAPSTTAVSAGTITFANQYQASWCGSGRNELQSKGTTALTPKQVRTLATPVVYTNKAITLNWKCETAATSSYASTCDPWTVLTIICEQVLSPPAPSGTLDVRSYAVQGSSFSLSWNVVRP